MGVTFEPIGTTEDTFFWSLIGVNDKVYAGTYEEGACKVYNYPPWTPLKNFGGEAVIGLKLFKTDVYAAVEAGGYKGDIYKMNPADPTDWDSVHNETKWRPKPFEVFGDYLYCSWQGEDDKSIKILRSDNGTDWIDIEKTWDSHYAVSFCKYNNQLYIIGIKKPSSVSWAARSPEWNDVAVLCDHPGCGWHSGCEFKGKLLLGQDGGQSVYRYDGSSKTKVLQAAAGVHGTHCCKVFDGQVYFLFGQEWRATSGESRIYRSPSGNLNDWGNGDLYGSPFKVFSDKPNARAIGVCNI